MSILSEITDLIQFSAGKKTRIITFCLQLILIILLSNKFMNLQGYYYIPQEININSFIVFLLSKEFVIVFFILVLNSLVIFSAGSVIRYYGRKSGRKLLVGKNNFKLLKFYAITGIISMNEQREYIWGKNYKNAMKQKEVIEEMGQGLQSVYSIIFSVIVFLIFAFWVLGIKYITLLIAGIILAFIVVSYVCYLSFKYYFVLEFGQDRLDVIKNIIENSEKGKKSTE